MIVYKATNKENGKVYVGATTLSLVERIKYHIKDAFREDRPLGYFQKAIMKYGSSAFDFEKLEEVHNKDEMYEKEQEWIKYYNSTDSDYGYNLDSGGIFCKKSDSTKRKIGDKKLEDWKDPELAERMREGLRKATDAWIEKSKGNKIEFVCPECGKVLYLQPYEAKSKRYCSRECSVKAGTFKKIASSNSERNAILAHENNLSRKRDIGEDIIDWAFENKNHVLDCKNNDITNHYKPLTDYIQNKYGISDLRSLYICFDAKNKKDFAQILKNIVSEENIC